MNSLGMLLTFGFLPALGFCGFIKFGPCLIGWKETCPDSHINFYLYTRENLHRPQKISPNKDDILKSNYDPEKENKIIIHGYNSDMNLFQLVRMKNEYLKLNDYNVWMIDWGEVAAGPCYPIVVNNLDYVGKCIAELVKQIIPISRAAENTFHLIGFSVGAHLAAYVANHVRPYKFSRITGLDPALPLFTTPLKDGKLDKSDAEFVDVLHTDALKEGKVETCGHIDFYVNGGIEQPGCKSSNIIDTSRCNHYRSAAYFAESITSEVGFYGWFCDGFFHYLFNKCPPKKPDTLMGEYVDKNISGSYILHTADKPPYAQGHNISRAASNFSLPLQPNVPFENSDALLQFSNSVVINEAFNAVEVSLAASRENVTFLNVP